MVKNVVVLGGSYAGCRAADLLARTLPASHRVVLIDRQSHFNHLYVFPRFGVVPNHAHKAFIPYTGMFQPSLASPTNATSTKLANGHVSEEPVVANGSTTTQDEEKRAKSVFLHASVLEIGEGYITVDRGLPDEPSSTAETTGQLPSLLRRATLEDVEESDAEGHKIVNWDVLIYATGCTLPPPLVSLARTKKDGVDFLSAQQRIIAKAEKILIIGGGALGVQYATDIADLYNNPENAHHLPDELLQSQNGKKKEITIVHSRERFLPLYDDKVDEEVKRRMRELGVKYVMGQRVNLPSKDKLEEQEKTCKRSKLTLSNGQEIEYDLLLRCTGQQPNSKLMRDFAPSSLDEHGFIRILPTLQVARPPSEEPLERVFAIGDVAAAGVIKAGHTGWNQACVAAKNACGVLGIPFADRTIRGDPNAPAEEVETLEEYQKSPPQIKVTLGLKHSVSELLPSMDAKETQIVASDEGKLDGWYELIWQSMNVDPVDPWK